MHLHKFNLLVLILKNGLQRNHFLDRLWDAIVAGSKSSFFTHFKLTKSSSCGYYIRRLNKTNYIISKHFTVQHAKYGYEYLQDNNHIMLL